MNQNTSDELPDLDNPEQISRFVHLFYDRLLSDNRIAPLFLDTANIDLHQHLPTISLYWQKMLLGHREYQNNTMAKHRALNPLQTFDELHYQVWLEHFLCTTETHFQGPYTSKARNIAINVIKNMKMQFQQTN